MFFNALELDELEDCEESELDLSELLEVLSEEPHAASVAQRLTDAIAARTRDVIVTIVDLRMHTTLAANPDFVPIMCEIRCDRMRKAKRLQAKYANNLLKRFAQ